MKYLKLILFKLLKKILSKKQYRFLSNSNKMIIKKIDLSYFFFFYVLFTLVRNIEKTERMRILYLTRSYSMVGRSGLFATYDIAHKVEKNKINGCFIECGVARGGCSAIMAMVASKYKNNRKVWLFDSFEGLPKPSSENEFDSNKDTTEGDKHSSYVQEGYCLGTYEEVDKLMFSKLKLDRENIFMVKGWFQETLPKYKDKIGKISFLRIDADWYKSTKYCLEKLYDNVVIGGYIYIDDYESCIGSKKATDEFLEKKLKAKLNFDNRGGVYFEKI